MNERQLKILQTLIEQFFESATPIGSKALLETEQFHFSGATLRNEMAEMEEQGLLFHPHTSAGRMPTTQGYRLYVDKLLNREDARKRVLKVIAQKQLQIKKRETRSKVWNAVNLMSETTSNLAFATLPNNKQTLFIGMANVLRQPEFMHQPEIASQVFEMVEKDFHEILENLEITNELRIFIGEENLMPNFASCSMLAVKYGLNDGEGILGILGPKRMDYGFNTALLEHIQANLNQL